MKVRKFILQEYDNHAVSEWRSIDGTVRNTLDEADALLKEFNEGKGYSPYGTNKFRIEAFMENS